MVVKGDSVGEMETTWDQGWEVKTAVISYWFIRRQKSENVITEEMQA